MGVKNFFTNQKAILEIFDLRQIEQSTKGTIPGSDGKIASRTPSDIKTLDSFTKTLKGNQLDAFKQAVKDVDFQSFQGINLDGMKKKFQVQFNPSDLQIEGYGGGRIANIAYNNPDNKDKVSSSNVTMMPMPVYVKMSVKLLFDRMDPGDCFLSAKTNVSFSSDVTSVVKGVTRGFTGKSKLTVQEEVEGLIAALRSTYTRCITFNWGDMSYQGILNRVASQYTMFDSSGEPVRAVVQLSLICADETVSPNSLGSWQDAYNTAFGGGSKSLVKTGQKLGSLLNIGR